MTHYVALGRSGNGLERQQRKEHKRRSAARGGALAANWKRKLPKRSGNRRTMPCAVWISARFPILVNSRYSSDSRVSGRMPRLRSLSFCDSQ